MSFDRTCFTQVAVGGGITKYMYYTPDTLASICEDTSYFADLVDELTLGDQISITTGWPDSCDIDLLVVDTVGTDTISVTKAT